MTLIDAKHMRGGDRSVSYDTLNSTITYSELQDEENSYAKYMSALTANGIKDTLHFPSATDEHDLTLVDDSNATLSYSAQDHTGRRMPSGFYENGSIKSYLNNKSIDAIWKTRGTNVHMWTSYGYNSWNMNQIFTVNVETIKLFPYDGNLCLDTYPSTPGQKVYLWTCNGGNSQKWFSDDQNRIRLKTKPGMCLDIASGNPNDGAALVIWYCHNGAGQKWYYTNGFDNTVQKIQLTVTN
jgi:hypothetical protein